MPPERRAAGLGGEEARAAIASLEQLPQAPPRRSRAPKEQEEKSREADASSPMPAQANGSNRDSA
ncbi:MAG: hypothetical protein ABSE42_23300 [Bryobacteraceae bacterium]